MFADFEEQYARVQMREIANSFATAAGIRPETRRRTLDWLTRVFEHWKTEQAIAQGRDDGTIEIEASAGLLGMPGTRIIPLAEAKPENCAGPGIRSAYDLFYRLWDEKYPPIRDAVNTVGSQTLAALLVERDAETMPLSSLALAVRSFYISTDGAASFLHSIVGDSQAKAAKQQAGARARAFEVKEQNKRYRAEAIRRLGIAYFQVNRAATNADAADHIWQKVKDTKEFRSMSRKGIKRKLAGIKNEAIALLPQK